jgi:hypothetical protein
LSKNRNASNSLIRNGTDARFEEIQTLTPPASTNLPRKSDRKKSSNSGLNNTNKVDSHWFARTVCFCLFGNQKNDFYETSHNSKRIGSPNQLNNKTKTNNNSNTTKYELINFDQIVETKLINDETLENNTKRKNNKKVRLQLHDETNMERQISEVDTTTMDQVVFGLREDHLNSSLSDKFNSDSDYIDLSFKSNEVNTNESK